MRWPILLAFLFVVVATRVQGETQSWTIGNAHVRRSIAFDAQTGLTTTSWRDLDTNTEFIDQARERTARCRGFHVMADGVLVTGTPQDVTFAGVEQPNPQLLDLTLNATHVPLRIVVHYEVPGDSTGVRQWLSIQNTGGRPLLLQYVAFQCTQMQPGPPRDLIAFGGYGEQPRETYLSARADDVALLMESARTGVGFAVLNEAPGWLRRTELGVLWKPAVQAMYATDLFAFARHIGPGETFTTAANNVVFYQRGTVRDPHWVLPQYVERFIAHNKNQRPPYWMYNDWRPWLGKATSQDLAEVLPDAKAMGLDLNVIDEGWERQLGSDAVNAERFPQGLEPVFNTIPGHLPARGLWLSAAIVSKDAPVYREHHEWVCYNQAGKPRQSQGQGVVMSLATPYREDLLDRASQLVRHYHLDYLKLDLTTIFNTYGEQPGCYSADGSMLSREENDERTYEGLAWIADQLHTQFPSLLIDYTYELWGEKHIVDFGLLRAADLDWLSNVNDDTSESSGPLQMRTLLYQRGITIPVEDLLIGNMSALTLPWQEDVATQMGSAPEFMGDLRTLPPKQAQAMREWIERYKKLRSEVALEQSFFPLGAWRQPRVTAWDGFGRFATSGEGLVVIFRNDSTEPQARIVIPGFPDGSYSATDWGSTFKTQVTGAEMRAGWSIDLKNGPEVRVLEIRKR